MLQWRVIVLAALATLLLLGGLGAIILPDDYEGRVVYRFDERHALRSLDVLGGLLLMVGSILSWGAGLMWQRRMHAS